MAKRHPIDLALSGVAGADGTVTLGAFPFKPGGLLCVQRVAVRSLDKDECYVRVAFDRAGALLYIGGLTTETEGLPVSLDGATYAPSDYGVSVEFFDLGAGQRVEAYIFGYWTGVPE